MTEWRNETLRLSDEMAEAIRVYRRMLATYAEAIREEMRML